MFRFEWKKQITFWLIILICLLPITLIASQWHHQAIDYRTREIRQANLIQLEYSGKLSSYDMEVSMARSNQLEGLSESDQALYEAMIEIEQQRYQYAVNAFKEDYDKVRTAKLGVYKGLEKLLALEYPLSYTTAEEIAKQKLLLEWQEANQVTNTDLLTHNGGFFLLFRSLPMTLSTFIMMGFILIIGIKLFEEFSQATIQFLKLQAGKWQPILTSKLMVFLSCLAIYLLSLVLVPVLLGIYQQIEGQVSLWGQVTYPIVYQVGTQMHHMSLGLIILLALLLFVGLTCLIYLSILLVTRYCRQTYFVVVLIGGLVFLMEQLIRVYPALGSYWFSPLSWLNISTFIEHFAPQEVGLALGLLGLLVLVLIGLVTWQYRKLKSATSRSLTYRFRHLEWANFEWVKVKRQRTLAYCLSLMLLLVVYIGLSAKADYQSNQAWLIDNLEAQQSRVESNLAHHKKRITEIEPLVKSDFRSSYQGEYDFLVDIVADIEVYLSEEIGPQLVKIREGDYRDLAQRELKELAADVDFLTGKSDQTYHVPEQKDYYLPNAYINHQITQWKAQHQIDFTPPGGPYWTLYRPSYEDVFETTSGDSGPQGLPIEFFEKYDMKTQQPMKDLSGLNLLYGFITDYYYLIFLGLMLIFLGLLYAQEYDRHTIQFMRMQPISLRHILLKKELVALGLAGLVLLVTSFTLISIGGGLRAWGKLQYPVVVYIAKAFGDQFPENLYRVPKTMQYFDIIPLGEALLSAYSLLGMVTIFVLQLSFTLSSWLKKRWASLLSVIVCLLLGYGVSYYLPATYRAWSPFTYIDIPKIITGEYAALLNQGQLNWLNGLLVLGASILCLQMLDFVHLRRAIK